MVKRTVTSTTPAVRACGRVTVSDEPEPDTVAGATAVAPNQTYTGTVVGKAPLMVIVEPPAIEPARGVIESMR